MSTLDEKTIKAARKNHRCHWCGERINKGESYHVWKGIYEGDFSVFKTHPECNAAAERTMKHNREHEVEAWDHERGLADHETREEVQP